MAPVEPSARAVQLPFDSAGELTECVLSGEMPCTLAVDGRRRSATVTFSLDLRRRGEQPQAAPRHLSLSLVLDGVTYAVRDDWFEDGIQRLEESLPVGARLVCCVTCLFSDYSPGGHGLTGIRCHRGAKDQYLAVTSKLDYWSVPVTEEVPETYLCGEYQRRSPGHRARRPQRQGSPSATNPADPNAAADRAAPAIAPWRQQTDGRHESASARLLLA